MKDEFGSASRGDGYLAFLIGFRLQQPIWHCLLSASWRKEDTSVGASVVPHPTLWVRDDHNHLFCLAAKVGEKSGLGLQRSLAYRLGRRQIGVASTDNWSGGIAEERDWMTFHAARPPASSRFDTNSGDAYSCLGINWQWRQQQRRRLLVAKGSSNRDADDRCLDLYLKEISTMGLITQEQEMELAKRIRQGDEEALHQLMKANLRFVVSVAKQYRRRGLSLADLINEGNLGLIKAALRFDESKGYKFISYAVWWIRQSILQSLAEHGRIVRLPVNRAGELHKIGRQSDELGQQFGREPTIQEIADKLSLPVAAVEETLRASGRHLSLDMSIGDDDRNRLLDSLEDDMAPAPDESLLDESLSTDVAKALESLTPREQEVMTLYFGIHRDRPHTLEEIGQHLGLTRERVRQIKEKALKKLRHTTRAKKLRAHLS